MYIFKKQIQLDFSEVNLDTQVESKQNIPVWKNPGMGAGTDFHSAGP